MMIINIPSIIAGVLYVISKPIKSYETLVVSRFITGFISGYFCGVGIWSKNL